MRVACQRLVLLLYVLLSSNGSDSQLAPIPLLFIEHKIPVGPVLATVFFSSFQYVNLRLFLLLGPHQVTRPGDELRRFNGLLCYHSGTGTSSNSAYSFARSADTHDAGRLWL